MCVCPVGGTSADGTPRGGGLHDRSTRVFRLMKSKALVIQTQPGSECWPPAIIPLHNASKSGVMRNNAG